MGCVYIVTNKINGKQYVGKTIYTAEQRLASHFRISENGCTTRFGDAIRKYGKRNFKVRVLYESDDESSLFEYEKLAIKELNTKWPHGYNMTDGGDGISGIIRIGKPLSESTREKISKKIKQKWSEDISYRTNRNKRTGALTAEAKAKISESVKKLWNDPEYGRNKNRKKRELKPANNLTNHWIQWYESEIERLTKLGSMDKVEYFKERLQEYHKRKEGIDEK